MDKKLHNTDHTLVNVWTSGMPVDRPTTFIVNELDNTPYVVPVQNANGIPSWNLTCEHLMNSPNWEQVNYIADLLKYISSSGVS